MKFVPVALALLLLTTLPGTAIGQRDYFTPEEVELIREAQQIDLRIAVLTHAIDRRFAALKVDVNAPKTKIKGEWGTEPGGSRAELLIDIKRILQKAIDDIDNLSERPASMVLEEPQDKKKKPKGFADLFPIAVRSLADAANRYGPTLKAELDKSQDPIEKGAILDSLAMCDEIVAAVAKLPSAATVETKKTKN